VKPRGKVIVLHFVGQMPLAGIAWQAMHYVLGLEKLGYEAWYVEDGAPTRMIHVPTVSSWNATIMSVTSSA